MLEPYRTLLDQLRRDRSAWRDVVFSAGDPSDPATFDPHYRNRLGVLVCLQYDRRDEDEALIREMMEQEVAARHLRRCAGAPVSP